MKEKEKSRVDWFSATLAGYFGGLFWEGAMKLNEAASELSDLRQSPRHLLRSNEFWKCYIRIVRGSVVGGVRLGAFTAAFYGLQNVLAETRGGGHDVLNVVGAGSATGAAFTLLWSRGFVAWPVRNAAVGAVLGATFAVPIDWLHLKIQDRCGEIREALFDPKHSDGDDGNDNRKA